MVALMLIISLMHLCLSLLYLQSTHLCTATLHVLHSYLNRYFLTSVHHSLLHPLLAIPAISYSSMTTHYITPFESCQLWSQTHAHQTTNQYWPKVSLRDMKIIDCGATVVVVDHRTTKPSGWCSPLLVPQLNHALPMLTIIHWLPMIWCRLPLIHHNLQWLSPSHYYWLGEK